MDSKNKDIGKQQSNSGYYSGLEERLRASISSHQQFLLGLTVDESVSCKSFVAQVAQSLLEMEGLEPSSDGFINIVSVDIDRKRVHEVLMQFANMSNSSLNGRLAESPPADGEYNGQGFIANTHITMAHYSQLPQKSMRADYGPIVGEKVKVNIKGFAWNQRVGALSVEVNAETESGRKVPKTQNDFPHITVWTDKGVSAAESNKLPDLLASGDAQQLVLPNVVTVPGSISFWSLNKY